MKGLPDETVAAEIVADISKEKLLSAKRVALLKQKLASDGLDEGDWVLLADPGTNEEG